MAFTTDKRLLPLLSVNFIGMLGMSIIVPFMVFIVRDYGGNGLIYGIIGAAYPAFQVVGAPLLGSMSDVYGRRRILMLSQAGTLFSWLLFMLALVVPTVVFWDNGWGSGGYALTLPLLLVFVARAFDGLTGGNISVANAYLADISTDQTRKRNFGRMGMSSSLGFVLGPALAGILASLASGYWGPLVAAALVAAVGLVLIVRLLPESKDCPPGQKLRFGLKRICGIEQEKGPAEKGLGRLFRLPFVGLFVLYFFLTFLAFNFFYAAFPNYAAEGLQWTTLELGLYLSGLSVMMIVVQGPVLSFLGRYFSEKWLIIGGCVLMLTTFVLFGLANEITLYVAAATFALGNGLMWPSYLSLLSKVGGKQHQGAVQGLANAGGSVASILGLMGGGWLYTELQSNVFYIPAALFIGLFFLGWRLSRAEGLQGDAVQEEQVAGNNA